MRIIKNVFTFILFVLVLSWLTTCQPYNSTDDVNNEVRSGMSLHTDYATGCQYLSRGYFSGLVPRVDGSGAHVGCNR